MNDSIKRISLDIHKPSSNETVNVKRGDTARKIIISLVDGGLPYIISEDCYAVFTAKKPDGKVVYNDCSIENNTIIYEVTEQTVAVEGRVNCEIKLYGAADKLITSANFTILVYGTVYNEGDEIESSDEFSALTKLVGDALAAKEGANEAAEKANEATGKANDATVAAAMASEAANQSASAAEAASKSANQSALAAATATQTANQAAEVATQATKSADDAAEEARNATSAAEQATLAAETAAKSANKAAHTAKNLMVIGKAGGTSISLDNAIDQFLVGLRIFGKTTQDGTPTPESPVALVSAGDGNVQVRVSGKNLIDVPELITFTKAHQKNVFIPKGTYIVSCGVATSGGDNQPTIGLFDADDARLATVQLTANKPVTVTFRNDIVRIYIYSNGWSDSGSAGISATIEHLMVSKDGGNYEAYKEQTMVINTPNGLPGIPVTSGGNYTDADGQQWICDEIDFERGVLVQRVGSKVFDGSSDEGWVNYTYSPYNGYCIFMRDMQVGQRQSGYCDFFQIHSNANTNIGIWLGVGDQNMYVHNATGLAADLDSWRAWLSDHPIIVQYILATPIETPLSEEELAAYASLHTYKDNTTVFNDAGAYMELEYVMDAKKYIDSLIVSAGGATSAGIVNATVE